MTLLRASRSTGDTLPNPARRMRMFATAMLLVMAAIFIAARATVHIHPAIGFVQAFAEAAMVGGLADWFAVTALFRHPLGLPIPHTAIIPRNKDRIGETLAVFLRDNFLTPAVVARRMRTMDVASAAGRFLASPSAGPRRVLHRPSSGPRRQQCSGLRQMQILSLARFSSGRGVLSVYRRRKVPRRAL